MSATLTKVCLTSNNTNLLNTGAGNPSTASCPLT